MQYDPLSLIVRSSSSIVWIGGEYPFVGIFRQLRWTDPTTEIPRLCADLKKARLTST